MPFIYTEQMLDNTSLIKLVSLEKLDIADILSEVLMVIRDLCKEKEEDLQKLLNDDLLFGQFKSLKGQIKEFSEEASVTALELSKTFFAEGILGKTYCFFDRLETVYKRTLHGLDIEEGILLACLDELSSLPENLKKNAYLFNQNFHLLDKQLIALPKEAMSDSLKIKVNKLGIILENIGVVARNADVVIKKIQFGCSLALAFQFFNDLKKDKMIPQSCSDVKVLAEHLLKHPDVSERYQRLTKYLEVGVSMWGIETIHRGYCEKIKKINGFDPKVQRLYSYNQALNPAIYLNDGLCMGGVRCWSSIPLKLPLAPNIVEDPNFLEHMNGWIDTNMLYHTQLNQIGFNIIKGSGDHVMFNVCTSDATKWRKQSGTIEVSSGKDQEAKISNEAYHLLIQSLFMDLEHAFKIYPMDVTVSVGFLKYTGLSGHGMGFKRHTDGRLITYHFFDLNEGEFYTEDFNALHSWFGKYFFEMEYHQSKYHRYELSTIVKKELPLHLHFLDQVDKLHSMAQDDRKILAEKTPVMLHLLKFKDKPEETPDEDKKYKEELIRLAQAHSEEENSSLGFEISKKILEAYEKIKNKSAVDHLFALFASSGIFRFLEERNSPPEKILECIEKDAVLIEILKSIKPAYGDLELSVMIDKALLFLKFPALDKIDEAILVLKKLCAKVLAMKDGFLDPESYENLMALQSQILKQLAEPKIDTISIIAILQKVEDALPECWFYFNAELLELQSLLVPAKVDTVALDEERRSAAEKLGELETKELSEIAVSESTNRLQSTSTQNLVEQFQSVALEFDQLPSTELPSDVLEGQALLPFSSSSHSETGLRSQPDRWSRRELTKEEWDAILSMTWEPSPVSTDKVQTKQKMTSKEADAFKERLATAGIDINNGMITTGNYKTGEYQVEISQETQLTLTELYKESVVRTTRSIARVLKTR